MLPPWEQIRLTDANSQISVCYAFVYVHIVWREVAASADGHVLVRPTNHLHAGLLRNPLAESCLLNRSNFTSKDGIWILTWKQTMQTACSLVTASARGTNASISGKGRRWKVPSRAATKTIFPLKRHFLIHCTQLFILIFDITTKKCTCWPSLRTSWQCQERTVPRQSQSHQTLWEKSVGSRDRIDIVWMKNFKSWA